MIKSFLNWIKVNRAIAIQCIALFLLSITVTIVVTRWRHKSVAASEGFDFAARRNQSSSGPKIGEAISLKIPKGEDGRSLAEAAGDKSLYMIAVVDPTCPACKAAESEMSGISKRLSSSGIPYFLLMLTNTDRTTQYFEYAGSIGLRSHALVWRTDETAPPSSLSEMVIPSHLLVNRDGLIVDKWPGTHQNPVVRQRMINQITADAISYLPH